MEYWQKEIKQRLERFNHGDRNQVLAVSIKVRVKSNCFCYGHSGQSQSMIDRHRGREGPGHWEYEEHESGPEWLLYLALTAAGLGIAEKSLGIVKSVIDLVAIAVKTHREERTKRDQRPEPLSIVVRGFGPEGAFFEKPVIEIDCEDPPGDEAIKESLADVIQQIAEERVRQDRV